MAANKEEIRKNAMDKAIAAMTTREGIREKIDGNRQLERIVTMLGWLSLAAAFPSRANRALALLLLNN